MDTPTRFILVSSLSALCCYIPFDYYSTSVLLFNSRLFLNSATIEFFSVDLCLDSIASFFCSRFICLLVFLSGFPVFLYFFPFILFLARVNTNGKSFLFPSMTCGPFPLLFYFQDISRCSLLHPIFNRTKALW
jgi:hypothetical protein